MVRGFKPLLHKMDNETSHKVEKFIQGQNTCLQYTPPDMHHTNPAERAIRTWKNHFLAGIAGLPKSFPIANWSRLTKQCDTTLNMLRPCRQNPLLSAHEALEGSFSFDATPMAPLGMEVLLHTKPNRRSTWGYHASKAWYLSHSPNHYHCIRVLMADTGGERITDTFRYNHHAIPVPKITATDRILDATARLTAAINGVQEAPPDELAAIESLRRSSLAKYPLLSQRLHQSLHLAQSSTRNMWKSGAQTKSKRPHASPVPLHLQVHRPTDGTCRPSSKMTPTTTTLNPRRS